MQYKAGLVTVTNGSNQVIGSGTLWLANVSVGDIFTIPLHGVWYQVNQVVSDTELQLAAPYSGATAAGSEYAVGRDFTSYRSYPYPVTGDVETASIVARALQQIDQDFQGFVDENYLYRDEAVAAATEAENWATYPSDQPVPEGDGTQFSALHHSARAVTAETNAENSEAMALKWAENPVDTAVETGKFSALHHAAKAAVSASNASSSANDAAGSASSASTSASNAAGSATSAAGSASAASTSETNAAGSASAAATSETNAANSEAAALALLNDFKGRYYGPLAADPAADPLGSPIDAGDLYFNTTVLLMKTYNGTAWEVWNAGTLEGKNAAYFEDFAVAMAVALG